MFKRLGTLALAVVLALPVYAQEGTPLAKPKRFPTPEAMADFTGDFTVDDGTFKVLTRQPLHLQVSVQPADPKLAGEDMFRAFLWGVYRTFLHTDATSVKVTVVSPVAVEGHKSFTGSATRTRALQVAREQLGVAGFDGLITPRQTWSDAMKRCMYSDQGKPGLRACALAVAGKQ